MTARRWSLLPFGAAVVTAAVLALFPVWTTTSCETSSAGPMSCSSTSQSLVRAEGTGVLIVLAVPVLLTLVALVFPSPRSRLTVAALLTVAMLVALASVGLFLLPTVMLAWLAVKGAGASAPGPTGGRSPAPAG